MWLWTRLYAGIVIALYKRTSHHEIVNILERFWWCQELSDFGKPYSFICRGAWGPNSELVSPLKVLIPPHDLKRVSKQIIIIQEQYSFAVTKFSSLLRYGHIIRITALIKELYLELQRWVKLSTSGQRNSWDIIAWKKKKKILAKFTATFFEIRCSGRK